MTTVPAPSASSAGPSGFNRFMIRCLASPFGVLSGKVCLVRQHACIRDADDGRIRDYEIARVSVRQYGGGASLQRCVDELAPVQFSSGARHEQVASLYSSRILLNANN